MPLIQPASRMTICALLTAVLQVAAQTTTPPTPGASPAVPDKPTAQQGLPAADKGAKPATVEEKAASPKLLQQGPLDPAQRPKNLPKNRPVIGLALGGGAALALTEIGSLQWFEEHHIPVDVIAGTSMGSILGALYSTGHTPEEMKHVLTPEVVNHVFALHEEYRSLNYRRRDDERMIPAGLGVGLRHGVSLRNALLTDTGLNELLDREFFDYNDQTDFNDLPIPFRCQATDLTNGTSVTFARGSLQDAVRASASLPGIFRPFELNGHLYVDGAVLENLPTPDVQQMGADVILAVSLPLEPAKSSDFDSLLSVLQRAFTVGIAANEERDRKLANVVMIPDTQGFTINDYLKVDELAKRGYDAAEAHKDDLLKYAVDDAEWQQYLARRSRRQRPTPGNVMLVKVNAPNEVVTGVVHAKFDPMVGKPVDTTLIEHRLGDLRADGRYDADYSVGYESATSSQPILLVTVKQKPNGPPFLRLGANVEAQSGGVTQATVATILNWQDLGGYGSALQIRGTVGYESSVQGEYYWKPVPLGPLFVAPHGGFVRRPYYIYNASLFGDAATAPDYRISERQLEVGDAGVDVGLTDGRFQELRLGWSYKPIRWMTTTAADPLPQISGSAQIARARYVYDNQDRSQVPSRGVRLVLEGGYLYSATGGPNAPRFFGQIEKAHTIGKKNVLLANVEGGTYFNRSVTQPVRFTLGGPLRLASVAVDEFRATDYFLTTPGYLRRIATAPAPLNSSIYVGGTYEFTKIFAPEFGSVSRQDVYFGAVIESPLGVITIAPAFGDHGERKFVFTVGRFF